MPKLTNHDLDIVFFEQKEDIPEEINFGMEPYFDPVEEQRLEQLDNVYSYDGEEHFDYDPYPMVPDDYWE